MNRLRLIVAVLLLLFVLHTGGYAVGPGGILLGATASGTLFSINVTTGAGTLIGTLPLDGSTEIAISPGLLAWTQSRDGGFTIQQFNPQTGAGLGSPVSDGASFVGLQFIGATLYGVAITGGGANSTLRTLNPSSGASVTIGATGIGPISGLAYNGTTLYGLSGGGAPSKLYTLNLGTGAATLVGATTMQGGGLAFGPDGSLYAGGTGGNAGQLYRINTATGASTLVGATGFGSTEEDGITGLALSQGIPATPAPPSLLLTLVGFAAVGGYLTRRMWMQTLRPGAN